MLLAAAMVVGAQNVASSMFEKNWSCLYVLTSVMTRMRREVRKLRARTKPWKRRRTRREKKKLKVNDGSHFNHNTKALPNTDVCPPPHTHTHSPTLLPLTWKATNLWNQVVGKYIPNPWYSTVSEHRQEAVKSKWCLGVQITIPLSEINMM